MLTFHSVSKIISERQKKQYNLAFILFNFRITLSHEMFKRARSVIQCQKSINLKQFVTIHPFPN